MDEGREFEMLADAFVSAHNRRDWVAMRTVLAEDIYVVDHRPVGWGELHGAEEFINLLMGGIDLTQDRVFLKGDPTPGAPARVQSWIVRGTDGFGGALHWEFVSAFNVRDGKVSHVELFPMSDIDEAIARAKVFNDE